MKGLVCELRSEVNRIMMQWEDTSSDMGRLKSNYERSLKENLRLQREIGDLQTTLENQKTSYAELLKEK